MSPYDSPPHSAPHLSAGAYWGKGIGPTHEHFPASDNQDSHVVLTLLLKQEREAIEGQTLQAWCWVSFPHTTIPHIFQSTLLCPSSTVLQSTGCVCGHPMPYTSLPVHLTASLPSQMLRADPHLHRRPWLIQTGPLYRQPHAHTMTLHPPNQKPPPGSKPGRPPDHQGYIPQSSLCFGRSGVCPRWRPTLWPVGGAHRHHMAVPLAVRAGSCQGLEWTGSWERIRDSLQGKDSSHWTQKAALSPY